MSEAQMFESPDEFALLNAKVALDRPIDADEFADALKGALKARSQVVYLIWKELERACPDIDAVELLGRVHRAWGRRCGVAWGEVTDAASALLAQSSKGGCLVFRQRFVACTPGYAQKDFGFCPHMEALDELGATPEEKRVFCQLILSEGDYGNLDAHDGVTLEFRAQIGAGDDHCSYCLTADPALLRAERVAAEVEDA